MYGFILYIGQRKGLERGITAFEIDGGQLDAYKSTVTPASPFSSL